jgi:hypothetical protein
MLLLQNFFGCAIIYVEVRKIYKKPKFTRLNLANKISKKAKFWRGTNHNLKGSIKVWLLLARLIFV